MKETLDDLKEEIILLLDQVVALEVSSSAIEGNPNGTHAPGTSLSSGKRSRCPTGLDKGGCSVE